MRTVINHDCNNLTSVYWKDALDKKLIYKHQLFVKQPKNLRYKEQTDTIEYHDNKTDNHLLIEVDDAFLVARYQYYMGQHFKTKESAKKFIDDAWIEPDKQELLDLVDKLKQLAQKKGITDLSSLLK